jgi:haloacetate dehalogenase
MFEGFERRRIDAAGTEINLVIGGAGPPVLLLHGYPQTHAMWHRVAPALARRRTVVVADLRGYGDSARPPGGEDHAGYSKRAMAADQVAVMAALGFERFAVVGHDRGARVGHRMALDHASRVEKLAVLDICPTLYMFERTDFAFAAAYYHWFFLIQKAPLPETLIGADPAFYLRWTMTRLTGANPFAPEAMAEYLRCFTRPETVHSTCEDYRAAASIDLEHDRADRGRKITCPLLALWGERGVVGRLYDVLAVWRDHAERVSGHGLPCGHYIPEEEPDATVRALEAFLDG